MIEKLVMRENSIPDGILHDQDLYKIELNGKELTLSFKTYYYPQDYTKAEFAERYKDFTKCHIKCRLENDCFCSVTLTSALNKKNSYKGKVLSVAEFVEIANAEMKKREKKGYHPWEYVYTYISPNCRCAIIELSIWSLKYKGTDYGTCLLELDTDEIEYIWE